MNSRLNKAVTLLPIVLATLTLTGCDKPWNVRLQGTVITAAGGPAASVSASLCYKISQQIQGCTPVKTDTTGAFFLDKSGESDLSNVQAAIKKENFYLKLADGRVARAEVLSTLSLVTSSDGVKAKLLGLFRMPAPPQQQPAAPPVLGGGTPNSPAPQPPSAVAPPAPVQQTWEVKIDGKVLDEQDAPIPGIIGEICYRVAEEIKGCRKFTANADGSFSVANDGSGSVPTTSVQRLNFYVRANGDKIPALKIETSSLTHENNKLTVILVGVFKKEAQIPPDEPEAALHHANPNAAVALLDVSGSRLHDRSVSTYQQSGAHDSHGVDAPSANPANAAI